MIDRNRVEEIQPGAFSQLGFLNLLSLTHNQLVYIPNMAFQVNSQNHLLKIERYLEILTVHWSQFKKETLRGKPFVLFRACRTSNGFV